MKLHRDEPEPVIELSPADLANEQTLAHVADVVEAGAFVYAPLHEPDLEPRASQPEPSYWHSDPPPPVKAQRLDNPARLDALRVALASHGLELRHVGAFYSRVDSLRAESKRCAS